MAEIPPRFRRTYPAAAKLIDELGFLKVRARDGWWTTADGLFLIAPVAHVNMPQLRSHDEERACEELRSILQSRRTRGTPRRRCERLLTMANFRPGETVLAGCLDSVTWRHRKRNVVLALTFRDHDFLCIHEAIAPDVATALDHAAKWPAELSHRATLRVVAGAEKRGSRCP